VEVLPNGAEASGAKRYTYNTAGYLMQVETHNGSSWDTQAEMAYNDLGQRLSMDAAGVIAYYVMDTSTGLSASGNRPLTATTGNDTTSYLYGLGVIGEDTNAWSYGLTDGTNTQRQLTDAMGEVTYSARYTPWGDTLETYGTGGFAFGYFGGLMDAATGLLYTGDGQYYDPSTGRFLTRNARPNSANPYLPFDPTGAIIGPLGLIALVFGRRKKGSKVGKFLVLALVVGSVGMTLAGCQFTTNGYDVTATPVPSQPNTYNITATPTTVPSSTPAPPTDTPLPTITVTCTVTSTPTPISIDSELAQYGVSFIGNIGQWTIERKEAVRNAVKTIASRFTDVVGGDPIQNFIKVYGYINFEFCDEGCVPNGYGWTAGDHWIKFDGMYSDVTTATRLIVHEMGHLFDRAVCASLNQGKCYDAKGNDLIWGNNTARSDLTGKTGVCLSSICLGRKGHTEHDGIGYWGFAGGWQVWQFGANDENGDGTNGELWADMFLGWIFNQWGDDTRGINRANYMNERMKYHLKTNFNL
jgi:hypothetical protein